MHAPRPPLKPSGSMCRLYVYSTTEYWQNDAQKQGFLLSFTLQCSVRTAPEALNARFIKRRNTSLSTDRLEN